MILTLCLWLQTYYIQMGNVPTAFPNYSGAAYEYQTNLASNQTSPWVIYPPLAGVQVSIALLFSGSGSGRVEYTIESFNRITNVTNGFIWPRGVVNYSTNDVLVSPVTAFRFVCLSGSMRGVARGQAK